MWPGKSRVILGTISLLINDFKNRLKRKLKNNFIGVLKMMECKR